MNIIELNDDCLNVVADKLPIRSVLNLRLASKALATALGDFYGRYITCGIYGSGISRASNSTIDYVTTHCHNLTSVDLLGTENSGLTGDGLVPLIVANPTLTRLRVVFSPTSSAFYRPDTSVFRALAKHCPRLTYLALLSWESLNGIGSGIPLYADPLEEKAIALLVRGCPLLEYLYVPCVDGHVVHQVASHAKHLRGFGVLHPELFSSPQHWATLPTLNTGCPQLISLTLANVFPNEDACFPHVAQLTNLEHLTIVDSPNTYEFPRYISPCPAIYTIRYFTNYVTLGFNGWDVECGQDFGSVGPTRPDNQTVYYGFRQTFSPLLELLNPSTKVFVCALNPFRSTSADELQSPSFYKHVRTLQFPDLQHIYQERQMLGWEEFEFFLRVAPKLRTCLFFPHARINSQTFSLGLINEVGLQKALQSWPNLIAFNVAQVDDWNKFLSVLTNCDGRRLRWLVVQIPEDVTAEQALKDLVSVCPLLSFLWVYRNKNPLTDPSIEFIVELEQLSPHLVAICLDAFQEVSPTRASRLIDRMRILCVKDADRWMRSRLQFIPERCEAGSIYSPDLLFDHDFFHPKVI